MPTRILVDDDDALILRMVTTVLENRGYDVLVAHDGEEVLISSLEVDMEDDIKTSTTALLLDGARRIREAQAGGRRAGHVRRLAVRRRARARAGPDRRGAGRARAARRA